MCSKILGFSSPWHWWLDGFCKMWLRWRPVRCVMRQKRTDALQPRRGRSFFAVWKTRGSFSPSWIKSREGIRGVKGQAGSPGPPPPSLLKLWHRLGQGMEQRPAKLSNSQCVSAESDARPDGPVPAASQERQHTAAEGSRGAGGGVISWCRTLPGALPLPSLWTAERLHTTVPLRRPNASVDFKRRAAAPIHPSSSPPATTTPTPPAQGLLSSQHMLSDLIKTRRANIVPAERRTRAYVGFVFAFFHPLPHAASPFLCFSPSN